MGTFTGMSVQKKFIAGHFSLSSFGSAAVASVELVPLTKRRLIGSHMTPGEMNSIPTGSARKVVLAPISVPWIVVLNVYCVAS